MRDAVTAAVASDDSTDLPERYFVKESVSVYADLAHDQLKDVMDGYEFFLPSPSGLSAGSSAGSV